MLIMDHDVHHDLLSWDHFQQFLFCIVTGKHYSVVMLGSDAIPFHAWHCDGDSDVLDFSCALGC